MHSMPVFSGFFRICEKHKATQKPLSAPILKAPIGQSDGGSAHTWEHAMSEAQWNDLDVADFSEATQAAYEVYKVAQREAAKLRQAFEQAAQGEMAPPEGMRVAFGYRFGKLSAALVADERKPAKAKAKMGLAEFMAAQQAAGRRV